MVHDDDSRKPGLAGQRRSLSGDKVVVTGGSGFIGSCLCARLIEQGAQVHALSRSERTQVREGVHQLKVDLCDEGALRRALHDIKPSTVFHLAGLPIGARTLEQVIPTFRSNLMSTVNVLMSAAEIGSRVLIAGSLEEPDAQSPGTTPSSPYAASKWASSAYARMFHSLFGLPVVHLRIFMVYGPGQRDRTKLVPHTIDSLLRGTPPKLTSGARKIDWIYVEDVAEGFIAAARTGGIEGQTIDLGSGDLVSIKDLVENLVDLIDPEIEPHFGAIPDRPFEQERAADVERTSALLGWRPRTTLDRGLALTVDWYKQEFSPVSES